MGESDENKRETLFHFHIDWESKTDNLESAMENAEVSKAQHLPRRTEQLCAREKHR